MTINVTTLFWTTAKMTNSLGERENQRFREKYLSIDRK
jgi:hypothetical protein